jgi:hypothetical protein
MAMTKREAAKARFIESQRAEVAAVQDALHALKARLSPGNGITMAGHAVIDNLQFRKLFAETFSAHADDYRIDSSCVRWKETEADFLEDQEGRGNSPCDADALYYVEHIIRPAMLVFPCSTDQALAWANRNRDTGAAGKGPTGFIYVPDWLVTALGQRDVDSALNVLADAGLSTYGELEEARALGDHEVQRSSRAELRNLEQAIQAFEAIQTLLQPSPSEVGRPPVDPDAQWRDISCSPKAKVIQRLVVDALNGLRSLDAKSSAVIDWIAENCTKERVRARGAGGHEYYNGAAWKELTVRAIGEQLNTTRKRVRAVDPAETTR